ncbi:MULTISPECIES: mechanosensitive ion channel family protein [unclassified Leeuwenhoekiella]|uniref:mechanosensitive ion channel family protein n=1 Tax=unclassified Leeuwenhoekiella TaxID=2615029 RepID=UPI000C43B6BE|nr:MULTISPECIES: mechanosensitive ion channel family protein [unclassified Leeuwenhoekiella]MAW93855.1 mechanosensitive ion channel protein MscS [Leeuwenhoekiella sp.]MBA82262.1 mechanosensitive ion channel protein MscS [Leeuwenhoekiella sp.]|tara:strand:- start:6203 stop:7489 length:1287 start_codon:yes stop_codon:yes gene_type:complete
MVLNLDGYLEFFTEYLKDLGVSGIYAEMLSVFLNGFIFLILLALLDRLLKRIIIEAFKIFSNKTKTSFDDFLVLTNFPRYIAHIIPLVLFNWFFTQLLEDYETTLYWLKKLLNIYVILLVVKIIRSILRTTRDYFQTKEQYHDKPLQSYLQVTMLFLWAFGIFFFILELFDRDPLDFILQLGAASAIILLIFKDTILGFVASIQVSINDIVRIGDWITFSKYGADGNVTEINLATVKVQNWDNTYTTIPTYSLISDSFQNWRGMQESEGRRIKRAVYIKQNSVRFLTDDDLNRLKRIQLVAPYIDHMQKEVLRTNRKLEVDDSLPINGLNQTNLGVFRKYIDAYLYENPAINKDLFLMVRHLPPTSQGIPLEIFCFSKDKRWEHYEHIQADIFDHVIAAVSYFDLEIFEEPSSKDITNFLTQRPVKND